MKKLTLEELKRKKGKVTIVAQVEAIKGGTRNTAIETKQQYIYSIL